MTLLSASQLADSIISAVKADLDSGLLPTTVRSFADLHDHVDANEYLIDALDAASEDFDADNGEQAKRDNDALRLVDSWLSAR